MEQLQVYDTVEEKFGAAISVIICVIGAWLCAAGMCGTVICRELWLAFGFVNCWLGLGIAAVAAGVVCIAAAYPIYIHITGKRSSDS